MEVTKYKLLIAVFWLSGVMEGLPARVQIHQNLNIESEPLYSQVLFIYEDQQGYFQMRR